MAQTGQLDPVLDALTVADRFSGGNSKAPSLTGYVLAKAGRRDEARKVLTTLESISRQRYNRLASSGESVRGSSPSSLDARVPPCQVDWSPRGSEVTNASTTQGPTGRAGTLRDS